jgi:hypothetical protein
VAAANSTAQRTIFFMSPTFKTAPSSLNRIGAAKSTCPVFGQMIADRKRWKTRPINATQNRGICSGLRAEPPPPSPRKE